jgi:hypothetical protein
MSMGRVVDLCGAWKESRHIHESDDRDVEAIEEANKPVDRSRASGQRTHSMTYGLNLAALMDELMSKQPARCAGLFATTCNADRNAVKGP